MDIKRIFTAIMVVLAVSVASFARATCLYMPIVDDAVPEIAPTAILTTNDGEQEGTELSGDAPMRCSFRANTQNLYSYSAVYEWRFTLQGEKQPYLTRYEENTDYTFTESGTHRIELYAMFVNGNDTVAYTQEYWAEAEPITIVVSDSKLEMPNAFSPNGDGINDVYKAKSTYRSIVEFHAAIYNRWGQKLFEWTDPASGWDGRYHGKDVAQGTYFVQVKATGADGRHYNIRKDVNLLRGYTESSTVDGE